jgi:hypothetical protein
MPDAVYTSYTDAQLQQMLAQVSSTSVAWHGITAEILRRQLASIHTVLERSEKLVGIFTQQIDKLLVIAEDQRKLAEILERQTRQLISLTKAVVGLTIGLLIFTIILAIRR